MFPNLRHGSKPRLLGYVMDNQYLFLFEVLRMARSMCGSVDDRKKGNKDRFNINKAKLFEGIIFLVRSI